MNLSFSCITLEKLWPGNSASVH
uniref:Uncharacterized protein n=1 Tax=Anguilla anguilla TaxID=7936 RepID=A0A0E9VSP5_ANGAN